MISSLVFISEVCVYLLRFVCEFVDDDVVLMNYG